MFFKNGPQFGFVCLELRNITVKCVAASSSYQEAHDVNIDHLVKVASVGFFFLINTYLVGVYFEAV